MRCYTVGVILSRWDWQEVARSDPLKEVLAFLILPVVNAQPYVYRSERDLHRHFIAVWRNAGVPVRHEVRLGPGRQIDFVSRGVGIEVKVAGSSTEVHKQLQRYAAAGKLGALLLLTACPSHLRELPKYGYGVPTAVIDVWASRYVV